MRLSGLLVVVTALALACAQPAPIGDDGGGADAGAEDGGGCAAPARLCEGRCAACPTAGTDLTRCEVARCVASSCGRGFARRGGACVPWRIEPLPVGGAVALALAPDGAIHLALAGDGGMTYLRQVPGSALQIEEVPLAGGVTNVAVALTQDGLPVVALRQAGGGAIWIAEQAPAGWALAPSPIQASRAQAFDLTLARGRVPALCYADAAGGLSLARLIDQGWRVERVDADLSDLGGCAVAVDRRGATHVAYGDLAGREVRYAHRLAGGWQLREIDHGPDMGGCVDLALDRRQWPHLGYGGAGNLYHASQAEWGWLTQLVDTEAAPGGCRRAAIALDAEDRPHFTYSDWDQGSYELKLASWTGAAWVVDRVDADFEGHSDLALGKLGRPVIVYTAAGEARLAQLP